MYCPGKKFYIYYGFVQYYGTALLVLFTLTYVRGNEFVIGVAGKTAKLPCFLNSPDPQDRAILALWYKQGRRLPVYSYDARGDKDRYQADSEALQERASFLTTMSPAVLLFKPVLPQDAGVYTCRVDYVTSATHNTVVNLTVIEPPNVMKIYDRDGKVVEGRSPPISEGAPLFLSCVVEGGVPQPTVRWMSDKRIELGSSKVTRSGDIQTDLVINEVTRSFHNKIYTCEASNNKLEPPLTKQITIDMNLRPLKAIIKVPTDPLVAGVPYTFVCETKGSKPSSKIEWYLEGTKIDSLRSQTREGSGEVTFGSLEFVPSENDNNKLLKCKASNPAIDASEITQKTKLNVHYSPIVTLELGPNLNPSEIKQGDDVYFECKVRANPKPYKVSWYKNGEEITQNVSVGILVTETSLVMQNIVRKSVGEYVCQASNTQGTQVSNPVHLDIRFAPECITDVPTVLAVGRGETVNISCTVASNPLKAMFHWQLNGSERSFSSPGKSLSKGQLTSKYNFVGANDKDYGSLLCWANNTVGTQEHACIFNIIPAGPPSAPENCEILNHTAENIEVSCDKGFDGGLAQTFLAEVYYEGGSLHLNASSDEPQFSVDSLRPGTNYVILVSSYNDKGRSASVSLTAYTLKVAEKRMGETESIIYSPLIIIFLSIVGVFVLIIGVLVLIARWRKNISNNATVVRRDPNAPLPKEPEEVSSINKETPTTPSTIIETKEIKPIVTGGPNTSLEGGFDKPRPKPKKHVMVVENGKVERPGISSGSPDSALIRDSLLNRSREEGFLPNGSAGYYNSLGKASLGSSTPVYHTPHLLKSPSYSSSYSPPSYSPPTYSSYSSSGPTHHHHLPQPQSYARTLPAQPILSPRLGGLSPLLEDYNSPPPYHHHQYSSLPRKRSIHGHYIRDDIPGRCTGVNASVEDRYHLMHEWRGNSKYLIRTRDRETDDESFV